MTVKINIDVHCTKIGTSFSISSNKLQSEMLFALGSYLVFFLIQNFLCHSCTNSVVTVLVDLNKERLLIINSNLLCRSVHLF